MWRSKKDSGSAPLSGCSGHVWSSHIPASSDYVDPFATHILICKWEGKEVR